MEKSTSKALLVFSLFVMALVVGDEGGRDMPKSYDQVYQQPQGPWGLIWPFFPLPLPGFGGIPGLGPLNFPTFAFPPPPSAPKYGIGGPQAHTEFKEMAQAKSP